MGNVFNTLSTYLQYDFVQYALIVGVLISLCASILGVTLVLKRFSFIGDGLSHVAFGAMAIATVVSIIFENLEMTGAAKFLRENTMVITMPVTVICAILILGSSRFSKIRGDAAVAMISVSALAIGYLLMNIFPSSSNVTGDVCSTLFGSALILTLSKLEVVVCIVASIVVVCLFIFFYNKIFSVTFDGDFARATGTRADTYNLIIAVIIAIIVVLAMNLVGSLLISALVVFPALSAMRVFKSFKSVTICAAVISVICSLMGMLVSIVVGTPAGSTIVAADITAFLLFSLIGKVTGRAA